MTTIHWATSGKQLGQGQGGGNRTGSKEDGDEKEN